jgi:hypothetical protein
LRLDLGLGRLAIEALAQGHGCRRLRWTDRAQLGVEPIRKQKRQLAASILDGADTATRLDSNDLLDLIRRSGSTTDEDTANDDDEPVPE